MKKIILSILIIMVLFVTGCNNNVNKNIDEGKGKAEGDIKNMIANINGEELIVKLENNSSVNELIERLNLGEIDIYAEEYGGFEKIGDLGFEITRNDKNINAVAGDLVLYQGNKISLIYGKNSWSYTKLGHIDIEENKLKELVGNEDITMIFRIK